MWKSVAVVLRRGLLNRGLRGCLDVPGLALGLGVGPSLFEGATTRVPSKCVVFASTANQDERKCDQTLS